MIAGRYKKFLKSPFWQKLVVLGLIFIFIFYFIPLIWHAFETIFAPYDINTTEGVVLNGAVNLFNGKTIYPQLDSYPYVPVVYPPLFHLIAAFLFVPIVGKNLASIRMLSFLSSLLAIFFVYKILFYKTRKRLLSVFISLLLLTSQYVYWWAPLGRIDWLAVAFGLIGLYLVMKYENSQKVFLSIPFFILAIFTKQSFFIEPVAVALYLFIKGKKRLSLNFSLGVLLISGAIFLILQLLTKGMFFIQAFKIMRGVPSNLATSWIRWRRFFSSYSVPFSLGAFTALVGLRDVLKKGLELFSLCFLFSIIIAIYSLGRGGAAENYLFEVVMFSYILMGLLFNQILDERSSSFRTIGIILILITVFGHIINFRPVRIVSWSPFKLDLTNPPPSVEIKRLVDTVIKNTDGKILVDSELGYLIRNDKQVLIDPLNMGHMQRERLWNFSESELARDLEGKNISLIVVAQRFFSPIIVNQIYKNYDLIAVIEPYYFYKPSDRYIENFLFQELLWRNYLFQKQSQDGEFSINKKFGALNNWQFKPYSLTKNVNVTHDSFYIKCKDAPGQVVWKIPSLLKKGKIKSTINLSSTFYETGLYLSQDGQEWRGVILDTTGMHDIELDLPSGFSEIYIKWEVTPVLSIIDSPDSAASIKSLAIEGLGGSLTNSRHLIFRNVLLKKLYNELIEQGITTNATQANEILKSAIKDIDLFSHQLDLSLDLLEIKNSVIDYTQLKEEAIRIFGSKSQLTLWQRDFDQSLYQQLLTSYAIAIDKNQKATEEKTQ